MALPRRIANEEVVKRLGALPQPFVELYEDGTIGIERFAPRGFDTQTPHDRDELYLIVSGAATLQIGHERVPARPGDLLFVPLGEEHHFTDISDDFDTWVVFFGPRRQP